MATFPIKSDLTIAEQNKMDALLAIASAQRTTSQAAWLASRLPYQTNAVIKVGADGKILSASGLTVPTGLSGFAKGATFIKTDASGKGVYENVGTSTTASWDLLGSTSSGDIEDGAVTDSKLANQLSLSAKIISMPGATPANAVAATGTLTTDNTEVAEGTLVAIGDINYKLTATLAAAYDVLIGVNADTTLDNLIKAVNASGTAGVEYFAGTLQNSLVSAGARSSHVCIMTARTKGVAGNTINKMSADAHLDWDGITSYFTSGVDGTVGVKDQIYVDSTNLYMCTAANGITGTNWKKLVLQSL